MKKTRKEKIVDAAADACLKHDDIIVRDEAKVVVILEHTDIYWVQAWVKVRMAR